MTQNSLTENSTLETKGGRSWPSMKSLVKQTGIPEELVSLAKDVAYEEAGFSERGSINKKKFAAWYESNKDILEKSPADGLAYLETEYQKRRIKLQDRAIELRDEEIKKIRGTNIDRKDLLEFLAVIGKVQTQKLLSFPDEINLKLKGLDDDKRLAVLKDGIAKIIEWFFTEAHKWT